MNTNPTEDLAAWLRLTLTRGLGGETQRKLLKVLGLPRHIFQASTLELAEVVGEKAALLVRQDPPESEIEAALLWSQKPDCAILTLADEDYPKRLLATEDPPSVLYLRGQRRLLQYPALAIVGSRNPTPQGMNITRQFARELAAKSEIVVVSGLALGIDQEAHRGALEGKGATFAVVGTGVDRVYPAKNRDLALQIVEHGLVISEFPLATPPIGSNFPRRNRIISGMSLGVLVVEAAINSGSLITARLAAEQGREVFAIPGSIHSPVAKGCHKLIREGAKLVECVDDILEEISQKRLASVYAPVDPGALSLPERKIIEALGHGPCNLDDIAQNTEMTAAELLPILLGLEMNNQVATLPGNQYQRI